MCFVWISEQTAIIFLFSINLLVSIIEMESVYCAVRTESIYNSSLVQSSEGKEIHILRHVRGRYCDRVRLRKRAIYMSVIDVPADIETVTS
jgi:hypothetical protein